MFFYNTKDFSIQLYAFQRQSILKASMPVGGATMLFVSHFLSMAKYLSKYSPSSTRSRSRWSSSNSEIPSLILWYAFLKHKSKCSGEKPSKKQRRLFPRTNYKLELEAQPVIFFLLRPALFSFRQLWSICAIHLGKGHELGTASWQGRFNSL